MEKTEQQSLLEQYTARVQQRLKRVAELLLELRQDGGDGERLGELTSMFHNLAGSGGAYGFYELSRIARRGETLGNQLLQQGRLASEPELRTLHSIARELKACLAQESELAKQALQTLLEATAQISPLEVIILEWSDEARERLVTQVHGAGLPAHGVSTAAELLAERTQAPSAVIADSSAVARDGFILLKQLRGLPGGDRTAIILIGNLTSFADKVNALRQGADACFEQGVEFATVFERLQELLEQRQQRGGSILIVDDDPDQVTLLRAILQEAGYQVHSCRDPRYFDHELELAKPDLIILDLLMPGILGSDLARYIRQDPQHRTVPIIMLSALDKEKLQNEMARGADLYLQKPVAAKAMLSAVKSCIENARRRGTVTPIEVVVS